MRFMFLPYHLNSDINELKEKIDFVSSENGIELYSVKDAFIEPVLNLKVAKVNLYYIDTNLITAYIHLRLFALEENNQNLKWLIDSINVLLQKEYKEIEGNHFWDLDSELLALLQKSTEASIVIYYTLKPFNIFILE